MRAPGPIVSGTIRNVESDETGHDLEIETDTGDRVTVRTPRRVAVEVEPTDFVPSGGHFSAGSYGDLRTPKVNLDVRADPAQQAKARCYLARQVRSGEMANADAQLHAAQLGITFGPVRNG